MASVQSASARPSNSCHNRLIRRAPNATAEYILPTAQTRRRMCSRARARARRTCTWPASYHIERPVGTIDTDGPGEELTPEALTITAETRAHVRRATTALSGRSRTLIDALYYRPAAATPKSPAKPAFRSAASVRHASEPCDAFAVNFTTYSKISDPDPGVPAIKQRRGPGSALSARVGRPRVRPGRCRGVGEARNRTRRAVERTVPFGLICFSVVTLWYALHGHAPADVAGHRARAR